LNPDRERHGSGLVRKLLWFAALWTGGVLVVALAAALLRLALNV
jgi:hypothetical protein